MHFSSAVALFAATAAAVPAVKNVGQSEYIVANYDDIAVLPATPLLNTIDQYKGLSYDAWLVNQLGVAGIELTGLSPKSGNQQIVSGLTSSLREGQNPSFGVENTGSKTFDLKSFYYGCTINSAEGLTGVAQACTFSVRGYRKWNDENAVASQQVSFTPKPLQLLQQPVKATFGRQFENLEKVELVQLESTSGMALNVLVLDDVAYNLRK